MGKQRKKALQERTLPQVKVPDNLLVDLPVVFLVSTVLPWFAYLNTFLVTGYTFWQLYHPTTRTIAFVIS